MRPYLSHVSPVGLVLDSSLPANVTLYWFTSCILSSHDGRRDPRDQCEHSSSHACCRQCRSTIYRLHANCIFVTWHIPLALDMYSLLFKLAACIILASACAAFLALLRARFRQRSLHKIPGPSNPSLFWGKILGLQKDRSHIEWNEQVIGTKCTIPMPFRSTKDYTGHMEP